MDVAVCVVLLPLDVGLSEEELGEGCRELELSEG